MKSAFLPASLLFLAAFAAPAFAQTEETPNPSARARTAPTFTIYYENDVFTGEDEHYTDGFKLSWLSRDLDSWGQDGWRKTLVDALPFVNRPDGQKNFGLSLGQAMYTPQDISRPVPDPTDRPYAGWSYLEFSFISKTESVMDTLSFQLGIVGRHSYAQDLQSVIHKAIGSATPRGWAYQLKDEAGVNVVYERKWRLYARSIGDLLGVDLVPHAGASLGNVQTYANAGGTARFGFNLPSDFGVNLIGPASSTNTPIDDRDPRISSRHNWSLFVFGGVDGRAVARDIFLDGNTFRDSASVDKENFVADGYCGVGTILGHWQLTYTTAVRTKEFKGQKADSHYGSVTLSRTF